MRIKGHILPLSTIITSHNIINLLFKTDSILVITNVFNPLIFYGTDSNHKFDVFITAHYYFLQHPELNQQYYSQLKNLPQIRNIYGDYLTPTSYHYQHHQNIKYKTVFDNHEYKFNASLKPFSQSLDVKNFLLGLLVGIRLLEEGGKLVFKLIFGCLTPIILKTLTIINDCFDYYEIIDSTNNTLDYSNNVNRIVFNNFKNHQKISSQLDLLNKIALGLINTPDYSKNLDHDFYYNYPNNSGINFFHNVDANTNAKSDDLKNMPLILDININQPISKEILELKGKLENNYIDFIYRLSRLVTIKYNNNTEYNLLYYNYLAKSVTKFIGFLDQEKIPYNKYFLNYLDDYYDDLLQDLISFAQPVLVKIVSYNNLDSLFSVSKTKMRSSTGRSSRKKSQKSNSKPQNDPWFYLRSVNGYSIKEFDHSINKLVWQKKVYANLIEDESNKKHLKEINEVVYDFSHGINIYLDKHFKLPYHPSNAFAKVWEIYSLFKLLPNKSKIKTFHFAEAPGQFVWSTRYYIDNNLHKVESLDWNANSLNPWNKDVRQKFGRVFGDDYGLMKANPKRWLWGQDNTGDITKPKNILWFRKQLHQNGNVLDLVTGDGGLPVGEPLPLQKLDYAQVCMVAATASLGKHCIVKHFTPFMMNDLDTINSGGFFVGYLYMYSLMFKNLYLYKPHTSNPTSGEFYVIGKYFNGVSDNILHRMLNILQNFQKHQGFFTKKRIPEAFVQQALKFYDQLATHNAIYKEKRNFLLTCILDDNDTIKQKTRCMKYLKPINIKKIKEARYKKWIEEYDFK